MGDHDEAALDDADSYHIPALLSLHRGLKPTHIPTDDVLIKHAEGILQASTAWKEGKSFRERVRTYSWDEPPPPREQQRHSAPGRRGERKAQRWYCFVTTIKKDEISFNKLWSKLGKNQVWHQKSHLSSLAKVTRIQYISEHHSLWTTLVTSSPPLSPRVYTLYQGSFLLEYSHNRRGIVVTLPIDLTSRSNQDLAGLEESGTRGRYLSVEHLQETDGGAIEWRKVACRDPGGMIPKFWVQRNMAQAMAEENISFLEWIEKVAEEDAHESVEELG